MIFDPASFDEAVQRLCRHGAQRPFITQLESGRSLSYEDFSTAYQQLDLTSVGLAPGDFAVFRIGNGLEDVILLFALLAQGIKSVLVAKNSKAQELKTIADVVGAKLAISSQEGEITTEYLGTEAPPVIMDNHNEIAYLVFTSGSSGSPKGIKISYQNMEVEIASMIRAYDLEPPDVHLCLLPIYHASGLYRNLLIPFFQGAHTIMANNPNLGDFWEIIDKHQVAFTQVTPTIIKGLIARAPAESKPPISLKYIGSASAPHPQELVMDFESTFKVNLAVGYGMTEATCGITLNRQFPRQNYSVGKPIDCMNLQVLKEGLPVEQGGTGEVVINGPNIMAGYLNAGESEKIRHKNGQLYTGDLGYIDEEGFLHLVGRQNDIVKRGDFRLNLLEIEKEIATLSFVKEACVIDIPHRILGTDIVAFVEVNDGHQYKSQEIIKSLKNRLDSKRMPSEVLPISEIPKFDQLKVNKRELKKLYEEIRSNRKRKSNV